MYIDTGTNTLNIHFYAYGGERNVINKTLGNEIFHASGKAKNDMDVLRPTIQVKIPYLEQGGDYKTDFNYAYIDEFDRYYFVVSVILGSEMVATIQLEVDPLESFKDGILSNSAYVERNEILYDLTLQDEFVKFKGIKDVDEYEVKGPFEFSTSDLDHNIVIATIDTHPIEWNQYVSEGGLFYPSYIDNTRDIDDGGIVTPKEFVALQQSKIQVFPTWLDAYRTLYTISKSYDSKIPFIKSLMAYPYVVPHNDVPSLSPSDGANSETAMEREDRYRLYLGTEPINDLAELYQGATSSVPVYLPTSKYRFSNPLVIAVFSLDAVANDFTGKSPYTIVEVYLPYYGWVEIPSKEIQRNCFYEVFYIVDYESGNSNVFIVRKATSSSAVSTIIFTNSCQLGVKIPLNLSNYDEIQARRNAIGQQTAISLISSAVSVGVGVGSGNGLLALGGLLGGAGAISNAVAQNGLLFEKAQANFGSGVAGLFGYQKVRVKITRLKPTESLSSTAFAHQFGRPLRQVRLLSTLRGFTLVPNIHLEGMRGDCYEIEKQMIIESLREGVIIK